MGAPCCSLGPARLSRLRSRRPSRWPEMYDLRFPAIPDWDIRISSTIAPPIPPVYTSRPLKNGRHPRRTIVIELAMNGCTGSRET
jgi:hypothetical protein